MKVFLEDGNTQYLNTEDEIKNFIRESKDGTYQGVNKIGEKISVYLISEVGLEVTVSKLDGTKEYFVFRKNGKLDNR